MFTYTSAMFVIAPMLSSVTLFLLTRTRFLMTLLAMESMLLMMIAIIVLSHIIMYQNNMFLLFILLTLGACEAALGLALLVALSRSVGSDRLSSLSINKC